MSIPLKIIGAEFGLAEVAKKYFEYANNPKELNVISGADHRFLNGGVKELLFESIEWINRLSKR